jgi:pimeloyl-ACP methyl ester carboxylesterase
MDEPTRPLPNPRLNKDGQWVGTSTLTPKAITTRGVLTIPPRRVIPVIVVPGIMGSNLRAKVNPGADKNRALAPGEPAWRPPNGAIAGGKEVLKWKNRKPKQRQAILDPSTLEVDDSGDINLSMFSFSDGVDERHARAHWWGEIHWGSYGNLLYTLEHNLNSTFTAFNGFRVIQPHWKAVNHWDRRQWGAASSGLTAPLTEAEFEKHACFHFPVYGCGYNWLLSSGLSAKRLKLRVKDIIKFWSSRKQDCKQVILVTHSMGGLVARACAKEIPDLIAGVVHGVMPALGAPLCYRRIACGTETSSPSASWIGNMGMEAFAVIAGEKAEETTPVMATAPGPLELLPNHLYPKPWLFVSTKRQSSPDMDYLQLPTDSPYDLYRDMNSWYRLIDPALADPADKYNGNPAPFIIKAINQAENFHKRVLDTYYHPNSYAFYGNDFQQRSFGSCRWLSEPHFVGLSASEVQKGKPEGSSTFGGGRNVSFPNKGTAYFHHMDQDASGDGTVPSQSGAGPSGKVKQLFATRGCDHQGSYSNGAMLALTQHLIVKIVQGVA